MTCKLTARATNANELNKKISSKAYSRLLGMDCLASRLKD
jgi:hypothetical protein